jgi:LruC domain-containing protein
MKRIIFFSLSISLLLFSCKARVTNTDEPPTGIQQLVIPDGFNYETTTSTDIEIILPNRVDFSSLRSRVSVYDGNPEEGGRFLTSGAVQSNGRVRIPVTFPTYLNDLYIQTLAGTVMLPIERGQVLSGSIKNANNTIDLNEDLGFDPPSTEPAEVETLGSYERNRSWEYSSGSKMLMPNVIQNGNFQDDNFGLINDWNSIIPSDGRWHITSTLGPNHVNQRDEGPRSMVRFTPSAARFGGITQIIQASAGDLVTFSATFRHSGIPQNTSWLFIIPRDANQNAIGFYSVETMGNTNNWINKGVAANMPAGTASVQILIWAHIYTGNMDFTNVYVTGPAMNDSDGDGVPDDEDDYPNDPLRAFDNYFPAKDVFGTLAYEDLWPRFGDYDMNDLVLDYNLQLVSNAQNRIKDIIFTMVIRATGAGYRNGFGISIPVPPSDVEIVTGTRLTEGIISTRANGLEAGHTNQSVIIAFDNADYNMGGFANVIPGGSMVEPDTIRIKVTFANPAPQDIMDNTHPFIFINQERGREVHLPGNRPTELVNTSFFGRDDDDTKPAQGRYYLSSTNLNWAFAVPQSMPYPIENIEIIDAFLKFAEWAESGGELYPDWYLDKPGYRDESKLYPHFRNDREN